MVANIELNRTDPKPKFLDLVCRIFKVDDRWLHTGEGEMFPRPSRDEELGALLGNLMSDRPESFRRRLITALLRFDPEGQEWQVIENIYEAIKNEAQD